MEKKTTEKATLTYTSVELRETLVHNKVGNRFDTKIETKTINLVLV